MKIIFCSLYLVFSLIIAASGELQYIEKPGNSSKAQSHRLLKHQVRQLSVRVLRKGATAWHLKNQVNALIMCNIIIVNREAAFLKNQATSRSKMKYLD